MIRISAGNDQGDTKSLVKAKDERFMLLLLFPPLRSSLLILRLLTVKLIRQQTFHRQNQKNDDHEQRQQLNRLAPVILQSIAQAGFLIDPHQRAFSQQGFNLIGRDAIEPAFLRRHIEREGGDCCILAHDLIIARLDCLGDVQLDLLLRAIDDRFLTFQAGTDNRVTRKADGTSQRHRHALSA